MVMRWERDGALDIEMIEVKFSSLINDERPGLIGQELSRLAGLGSWAGRQAGRRLGGCKGSSPRQPAAPLCTSAPPHHCTAATTAETTAGPCQAPKKIAFIRALACRLRWVYQTLIVPILVLKGPIVDMQT